MMQNPEHRRGRRDEGFDDGGLTGAEDLIDQFPDLRGAAYFNLPRNLATIALTATLAFACAQPIQTPTEENVVEVHTATPKPTETSVPTFTPTLTETPKPTTTETPIATETPSVPEGADEAVWNRAVENGGASDMIWNSELETIQGVNEEGKVVYWDKDVEDGYWGEHVVGGIVFRNILDNLGDNFAYGTSVVDGDGKVVDIGINMGPEFNNGVYRLVKAEVVGKLTGYETISLTGQSLDFKGTDIDSWRVAKLLVKNGDGDPVEVRYLLNPVNMPEVDQTVIDMGPKHVDKRVNRGCMMGLSMYVAVGLGG